MPRGRPITTLDLRHTLDTALRGFITSEHIAAGSVAPWNLGVQHLSDVTQDMGELRAGSIVIGNESDNVAIRSVPSPRIEATQAGELVFVVNASDQSVVVGIGEPMQVADGSVQYPIQVLTERDPITGNRLRILSEVIVTGQRARTFLTGDYIWIGSAKTPLSHPSDPEVQGVLLGDDGLWGYRGGEAQAGIGTSGRIVAGTRGQTMMDAQGLWSLVNETFGSGEGDVGHRFFDADGNVVGGMLMDANLVQGQAYLNLFAKPSERFPYVEANLLAASSTGNFGGVYVASTGAVEIRGVDTFSVNTQSIQLTSFYPVSINHPYEGWGMGYINGRPRVPVRLHFPPVVESLENGEICLAQEGGQSRLYIRMYNELCWFEPDGVIT